MLHLLFFGWLDQIHSTYGRSHPAKKQPLKRSLILEGNFQLCFFLFLPATRDVQNFLTFFSRNEHLVVLLDVTTDLPPHRISSEAPKRYFFTAAVAATVMKTKSHLKLLLKFNCHFYPAREVGCPPDSATRWEFKYFAFNL